MQLTATRKKIEEKKLSNDFVRVNAEKGVMNAYRQKQREKNLGEQYNGGNFTVNKSY